MMNFYHKNILIVNITIEGIYAIFMVLWLISLYHLNQRLASSSDIKNAFAVVSYNSYEPVWYFLCSIILVAINVWLMIRNWRSANHIGMWQFWVLALVTVLINVLLIIVTWLLINNPILRSILIALIFGFSLLQAIK